MKTLLNLIRIIPIMLLGACSIGNKEVSYSEMSAPPKLNLQDGRLIIEAENSKVNSALVINRIDAKVLNDQKELKLSAIQGMMSGNKETGMKHFEIDLSEHQITNLEGWKIYWIDPDGTKTKLEIEV